ncbi:MAG TPA: hypothetical protein VF340_08095 [Methyloceanibacter sp.]
MRIGLAVFLTLTLSAALAGAAAAPDSDPVSLIKAIYATYLDKNNDNPGLPHVYSKRAPGADRQG